MKKVSKKKVARKNKAGIAPLLNLSALFILLTVFVSGGVVMVVELTGNKFLAPLFGNSIFTWTALIGIVLVAVSFGGFVGGIQSDKTPKPWLLSFFLLGASFYISLAPFLYAFVKDKYFINTGLIMGPIYMAFFLLALPVCLLGAITPSATKILVSGLKGEFVGSAAGAVSMSGALGSFIGTFAAGFFLIPLFNIRLIFLFCALVLSIFALLIGIIYKESSSKKAYRDVFWIAIVLILFEFFLIFQKIKQTDPTVIHEQSSFYHDIKVKERKIADGKTARLLILDTTNEGGQIIESGELAFEYQKYWQLGALLAPHLRKVLFIGAGGFGMPKKLAQKYPNAHVQVIDIDPKVIQVGRDYFGIDEFSNIKPIAEDGRRFLLRSNEKYDIIFADAYNGVRNIPAHLTTLEFFKLTKNHLHEDGIFFINIISALSGEKSELFQAISNTLALVFKKQVVFAILHKEPKKVQNILIFSFDADFEHKFRPHRDDGIEIYQLLARKVYKNQLGIGNYPHLILKDEHNPIEIIIARQLLLD